MRAPCAVTSFLTVASLSLLACQGCYVQQLDYRVEDFPELEVVTLEGPELVEVEIYSQAIPARSTVAFVGEADVGDLGLIGGVGFVSADTVWACGQFGYAEIDLITGEQTRRIAFDRDVVYQRKKIAFTRVEGREPDSPWFVPSFSESFPSEEYRVAGSDGGLVATYLGGPDASWSIDAGPGVVLSALHSSKPIGAGRSLYWTDVATGERIEGIPPVSAREDRMIYRFVDGNGSWAIVGFGENELSIARTSDNEEVAVYRVKGTVPGESKRVFAAPIAFFISPLQTETIKTPVFSSTEYTYQPTRIVEENNTVLLNAINNNKVTSTALNRLPDYTVWSRENIWAQIPETERDEADRYILGGHARTADTFDDGKRPYLKHAYAWFRLLEIDSGTGRAIPLASVYRPFGPDLRFSRAEGSGLSNAKWVEPDVLRVVGVSEGSLFVLDVEADSPAELVSP